MPTDHDIPEPPVTAANAAVTRQHAAAKRIPHRRDSRATQQRDEASMRA